MMLRRRLLSLALEAPWQIAAVALAGLAALAASAAQGVVGARALLPLLKGEDWRAALPALGLLGLLILLRALLQLATEAAAMLAAGEVKRRLRQRLFRHLLRLGPGYLAGTRAGFLQSVLVDAVEALEGYLGHYLPQVAVTLIGSPLVIAALFAIDPPTAWLVAACFAFTLLAPPLWERVLGEYGRGHWRAYGELAAAFHDSLQGMTTLKAFGAAGRRGAELHEKTMALYRETMAQLSLAMARSGLTGLSRGLGTAFAVGYGALRVSRGELEAPALLLILFLTAVAFAPLDELDRHWHRGFGGATAEPLIRELLESRPAVEEQAEARESAGASSEALAALPSLRFENVTFAYPGQPPTLRNLTFEIGAGERVALAGASGAGKSTVAALALRFYDPQEGRILLGGRDLADFGLDALRRSTAWVAQDTFLFPATLEENLRLARPEATREELAAAVRAAGLADFVSGQPAGYATSVGERGLSLSGGERQRLAIARALLKDAPLLILDEATSAVDNATEREIGEALRRAAVGRTTLLIAHRLAALAGADRVVVLADGRVAEQGTPAELLAAGGIFTRLVAAQAEEGTP